MVAQAMLRVYQVKYFFSEKKNGFDDSVDVTKGLQQNEMPNLLHMCAMGSELPSNKGIWAGPKIT